MKVVYHFGPSIATWALDMTFPDQYNMSEEDTQIDTATESTNDNSAPPELQPSDYVEIGLLLCMVVVGGPLNAISLLRALGVNLTDVLRCCYWVITTRCGSVGRQRQNRGSICQHPLTLRFHLTVANLLVLWVYAISEICWLSTYSWRGGDILCRLVRFVHAFCFYATSNLVAAIGIDRLHVTVYVDRPNRPQSQNSARWLASIAWILAFASSVPQLFIWGTFKPFPGLDWSQCVTTWTVKKYYDMLANNETESHHAELNYQEKLYDGLHLALVFWIPAIFITVSYASIVTTFNWNIRKTSQKHSSFSLPVFSKSQTLQQESFAVYAPYDAQDVPSLGKSVSIKKTTSVPSVVDRMDGVLSRNLLSDSPVIASPRPRVRSVGTLGKLRKNINGIRRKRHTSAVMFENELTTRVDDDPSSAYSTMLQSTELLMRTRQRSSTQPSSTHSFAVVTLTRAKRRAVRKTVWILLAYFLFWSPYNVLALYRYFYPHFEHSYLEIMYNLIVLNAVVNPLIYGI